MNLLHPLPVGDTTAWFGSYPGHRGHDWAAPANTPIRAAHAGVVTFAGWDDRGGWMVNLHDTSGQFGTSYQHMNRAPSVKHGDRVVAGQQVGNVGSTGFSTGNHLHFELWEGDRVWGIGATPVDPLPHVSNTIQQEETMSGKAAGFYYTRASDGAIMYLIVHALGSGIYHEYTDGGKGVPTSGAYNNPIAATFGTGSFAPISEAHARVIREAEDRAHVQKVV